MTDGHEAGATAAFDLDVLAHAERYQRWVMSAVTPWLGSRIIEIGSGTGNMSRWLPVRDRLILTEPDDALRNRLERRCADLGLDPPAVSIERYDPETDTPDRFVDDKLDTAVSFNVLEHIRDDATVVRRLVRLLDAGTPDGPKRLVMFVPAHLWAYGSLDRAFDHERRYSRNGLRHLLESATSGAQVTLRHFNLVGLPGWLVTGRVLRRTSIPASSIRLFEAICLAVRPVDDFLHTRLRVPIGQSLIGVAQWR